MNCFLVTLERRNIIYILKYLALSIGIVLFIEFVKFSLNLEEPKSNKIEERIFNNLIWSCFGAVFFSPLLEEMAFRLSLKRNRYFVISIIICFAFLLSSTFIYTQVICTFFIVAILINQFENKLFPRLVKFSIVFFSVLSFVTIHFDNYEKEELDLLNPLAAVVLFMPQFILCLILTKVRMETCFMNSLIIHSLYNLLILTFALFFNY